MHWWMYCTARSGILSRQISHSCENEMNDKGRSIAWGERWRKWGWECFTRQTIIDTLFTAIMCHLTILSLLQFRNIALCWLASWLCRLAANVSSAITSDWLRLGKPRKTCFDQQVWLQRIGNITELIFTEVDTMHSIPILYVMARKNTHTYTCAQIHMVQKIWAGNCICYHNVHEIKLACYFWHF